MTDDEWRGATETKTYIIKDITSCRILSPHTDISAKTGERIIVFTVDENSGEKF